MTACVSCTSSRIGFYPSIQNVDNTVTVPVTWIKYTQESIARSCKERESSERLRGTIDALMRACASEMWNQFNAVNNAFNTRIHETSTAKNSLQTHLQRAGVADRQRLQKEVAELKESVRVLKEKLRAALLALSRLNKARETLQHDVMVKEDSLAIDSKTCMGMRKHISLDSNIAGPIFNMPLVS